MNFEEKPWGRYDVLYAEKGFKVKKIKINPNHRLSLQLHNKRSEHWIICSGSAEVNVGEEKREKSIGDYIFIPIKTPHRITNKGEKELIFIEVSLGDYIEEDDIVRIEDDYGR